MTKINIQKKKSKKETKQTNTLLHIITSIKYQHMQTINKTEAINIKVQPSNKNKTKQKSINMQLCNNTEQRECTRSNKHFTSTTFIILRNRNKK